MGLLDAFRLNAQRDELTAFNELIVSAGFSPFEAGSYDVFGMPAEWGFGGVSRSLALTVPAVARARGIIAGTISTLPLKTYGTDNREILNRVVINQPDPAVAASITWAYLIDNMFFYGVGFLQVLDVSPADGRPFRLRFVAVDRVTQQLNQQGTLVVGYMVDGQPVPKTGVNSLIRFDANDEGILWRGARTINTLIAQEKAALNYALEPTPSMWLNNKGMNADPETKSAIKDTFRKSRQESSVAYTEGDFDLNVLGFDSAQLQLVEGRTFGISEIARLTNVPAWYLNAETQTMTYSNTVQERRSLLDYCLRAFINAVEARLSMDDLTPRGQYVRFDLSDFLRGNDAEQADLAIKLYEAGLATREQAIEMVDIIPNERYQDATDNGTTPQSQIEESPNV